MTVSRHTVLWAGLGAWVYVGTPAVFGQEVPRYSLAGVQAAVNKRAALEKAPYFAQLGNLRLSLAGSMGVEYNDNVNLGDRNGQPDLILRPGVQIASFLPITALNSLNFSLGLTPAFYVRHSEYDRMLIAPGSELGFDFYIGDCLINLHDRFSYEQDPVSAGSVSGSAVYGGFNNSLGAQALWDLNKLVVTGGYDHGLFASSTSTFNYLNRQSDSFNARGNLVINESATVGLYAAVNHNYYEQHLLNDHYAAQAGVDGALTLSPHLRLSAGGGWINYFFERTSIAGPAKDQTGFSAYLELGHDVNQKLSYTLRGERSLQMGVGSELLELTSVQLRSNVKVIQNTTLEVRAFFEDGNELGSGVTEQFQRFGAGATAGWQLTLRWRTELQYSFTLKNSNLAARDYRQNSVLLQMIYRF